MRTPKASEYLVVMRVTKKIEHPAPQHQIEIHLADIIQKHSSFLHVYKKDVSVKQLAQNQE